MKNNFNTPILFLIFNRPDTTQKVFEVIRQFKPKFLFVAADGPRLNKEDEKEKCEKTRNIIKQIDWDCELKTLFRDENLGCKMAVSEAITWFFEHVEEGIILEDDCLPSQSFFKFCEELLDRYRNDTRIMLISGYNKQNIWNPNNYDYFFSNLGGIWGWASWRRAWIYYDDTMKELDNFSKNHYFEYLFGEHVGKKRKRQMYLVGKKNIDTWDYPWGFSRHLNSGMACVPSKNLIQNIGFGTEATHTKNDIFTTKIVLNDFKFPLRYNDMVVVDKEYDRLFLKYNILSKFRFLLSKINKLIFKK